LGKIDSLIVIAKEVFMLVVNTTTIQMLPDGRMDVTNAAHYLGLKEKTLAMWRASGLGPRFIKRGRIFYYREDLDAWLNEHGRHRSIAQAVQRSNQFTEVSDE
jgi:Helix-turn-helix domain